MCNLMAQERVTVDWNLAIVMERGVPFTGYEVALGIPSLPPREVSAYVREQFNLGKMPGWASTQVNPGQGPVLYFRVRRFSCAWFAARKIRKAMSNG